MRAFRSFTVPFAGVLVLLALVTSPLSAAAGWTKDFHVNFSDPVDAYFCGQYHAVGTAVGVTNGFEQTDSNGNPLFKVTQQFKGTFTLDNGNTFIETASGQARDLSFVDNGDGTGTLTTENIGMPGRLITGNKSLDVTDVGRLVRTFVFDLSTGNVISSTVDFEAGPHPEADSDFTLVCNNIGILAQ
jgi:hypothetical protein